MAAANSLSDRVVNSANDLKEKLLAHPFLSSMLLKGEVANGREVLTRKYKYYNDTSGDWKNVYETAAKKAQTPEERQHMEQLAGMVNVLLQRYDTLFKAKFMDYDQTVMSKPTPREAYPEFKEKVEKALNAPLIDLMLTSLATIYIARLYADLKFDPNYKPNWFYDFFIFDYNQLIGMFTALKTLIDNRGAGVSDAEEQRLAQLFRSGLQQQTRLLDLMWFGKVQ